MRIKHIELSKILTRRIGGCLVDKQSDNEPGEETFDKVINHKPQALFPEIQGDSRRP
jgi:hypothetical protein